MALRKLVLRVTVRYSLRALLAGITVLGLCLPWIVSALQRPVEVSVVCAPIRMPTRQMPDEADKAHGMLRPRFAFREWFAQRGFALDPANSLPQADLYRGQTPGTSGLAATVRFNNGFAHISMQQSRDVYPWQKLDESQMDERGIRLTNEAHAFAKRFYMMEQGIRRLAGVEDRAWQLPAGAASTPGIGYAPPVPPPLDDPLPAWRQGFYHSRRSNERPALTSSLLGVRDRPSDANVNLLPVEPPQN